MSPARSTTDSPVQAEPLAVEPGPGGDPVLELLRGWLPGQRWFPAKGTHVALSGRALVRLTDPLGEAEVQVHLLRLSTGAVLQVPVTVRPAPAEPGPAQIGLLPASPGDAGAASAQPLALMDGCLDEAFLRAWLSAAEQADPDAPALQGEALEGALRGMRLISGEQSNTSVMLPGTPVPSILKVFRGLSTGPNPDVVVPLALSGTGWTGVPRPLAWLTATWDLPASTGGGTDRTLTHLGVLSELVMGARDGFELACELAGQGRSFAALAEDLGRTTAQMHRALASALPTSAPDGSPAQPRSGSGTVVGTLRHRAAEAVAAAPELVERAAGVERVLAAVEHLGDLPPLQRVHGDYHLGQVLRSPDRGWVVLDFEGEPQATEAERNRPDLALRDLAGMLRSMDYAAEIGGAADPRWAAEARSALVDGYRAETGSPAQGSTADGVQQTLLRALELDKALYEVVYESRNRPAWLHVPLAGVDRLLALPG
ncbi:phosphotransferase [Actinotalea sp. K2]|uniref:maltokinase N-terminal cap-like domain-containing protein n=1 Tax=Actinotalea sp. K2 TaxID=2939438 RepID=UPI0020183D47|nr:phosphotransferase [Actinotalea sp. K2]MCL3860475.1 phosphotransferase [Actinotalea sp. K2]